MKNSYYYPLNYNLSKRADIVKILARHGLAGFGAYSLIVSKIANNGGCMDIDIDSLAYSLHTDSKLIHSIVYDFGSFIIDDDNNTISEQGLNEHLEERKKLSKVAVKSLLTIKKKKEKVFTKDSFEYFISNKFLENNYNNANVQYLLKTKGKYNLISSWCIAIDKLLKIDKYTEKQIEAVCDFIFKDNFWQNQILTPNKLRIKNKMMIPYFIVIVDKLKNMQIQKQKKTYKFT